MWTAPKQLRRQLPILDELTAVVSRGVALRDFVDCLIIVIAWRKTNREQLCMIMLSRHVGTADVKEVTVSKIIRH